VKDHEIKNFEKVFGWIRKHWNKLWYVLGLDGFKDILRELLKGRMMDWLTANLGKLGRFIYQDPFSLLTIGVVIAIIRLLWMLVIGSLRTESPIVGAEGEIVYRSVIERKVAVRIGLVSIAIGLVVVYGYAQYRKSPAIFISEADAWYGVGINNALLYVAVNVKNYSPVAVRAKVTYRLLCSGVVCPHGESRGEIVFPPWEAYHSHGGIFLGAPGTPTMFPDPHDPNLSLYFFL
jgi:hypothetical protein